MRWHRKNALNGMPLTEVVEVGADGRSCDMHVGAQERRGRMCQMQRERKIGQRVFETLVLHIGFKKHGKQISQFSTKKVLSMANDTHDTIFADQFSGHDCHLSSNTNTAWRRQHIPETGHRARAARPRR